LLKFDGFEFGFGRDGLEFGFGRRGFSFLFGRDAMVRKCGCSRFLILVDSTQLNQLTSSRDFPSLPDFSRRIA
jgi:hypothetical protein